MKCKICGAELKRDGDICNKCYEKYKKEEELEMDTRQLYQLKSTFVPGYEIWKWGEYILFGVILLLALLSTQKVAVFFGCLIVFIAVIVGCLKFKKKKIQNTTCTFYEKKIVYNSNGKEKILLYKDIKDMGYFEDFSQKLFKVGDIRIYPENAILITSAINIESVRNVKEEYEKVKKIVQEQIRINTEEN